MVGDYCTQLHDTTMCVAYGAGSLFAGSSLDQQVGTVRRKTSAPFAMTVCEGRGTDNALHVKRGVVVSLLPQLQQLGCSP